MAADARRAAERRGRRAEDAAALWLVLQGWRVLARGFRVHAGEVDLIARRGRVTAFVEVKARDSLADAAEAVTARQRRRIARAAEAFLAARPPRSGAILRFDVVLVRPWRLPRHLPDAWRP
ncbi:MAG: YraN family protein [Alphaproteobacteria bacterium]